jgi:hypothetical protein
MATTRSTGWPTRPARRPLSLRRFTTRSVTPHFSSLRVCVLGNLAQHSASHFCHLLCICRSHVLICHHSISSSPPGHRVGSGFDFEPLLRHPRVQRVLHPRPLHRHLEVARLHLHLLVQQLHRFVRFHPPHLPLTSPHRDSKIFPI